MRRVRKILQREWECALCAGAALALLLFGLHWLLAGSTQVRRPASGRLAEPPPLLGPRAFAFVEAAEPGPAPSRNPFLSSVARRAPPPRPAPPPRRPPPAPPAEPKPPTPPATPPATPPPAPAVTVPTTPPAPAR
ncbi:MAG: hypothetical protein GX595_17990, partial [Lentisphaerae bacterium]|nr:hypothetical protein [Lentisphaerota bacterium]